jgi:hypothetical protein
MPQKPEMIDTTSTPAPEQRLKDNFINFRVAVRESIEGCKTSVESHTYLILTCVAVVVVLTYMSLFIQRNTDGTTLIILGCIVSCIGTFLFLRRRQLVFDRNFVEFPKLKTVRELESMGAVCNVCCDRNGFVVSFDWIDSEIANRYASRHPELAMNIPPTTKYVAG